MGSRSVVMTYESAAERFDEGCNERVRYQYVEIAVFACLTADQCIDAPTAGDDRTRAEKGTDLEHPENVILGRRHASERKPLLAARAHC